MIMEYTSCLLKNLHVLNLVTLFGCCYCFILLCGLFVLLGRGAFVFVLFLGGGDSSVFILNV